MFCAGIKEERKNLSAFFEEIPLPKNDCEPDASAASAPHSVPYGKGGFHVILKTKSSKSYDLELFVVGVTLKDLAKPSKITGLQAASGGLLSNQTR